MQGNLNAWQPIAVLLAAILSGAAGAQQLDNGKPPVAPAGLALTATPVAMGPQAIRGGACAGGEIYDDGSAENGYSGDPATISSFEGVQRFTPASYPNGYQTVCIGLVSLGGANLDLEIEVRDDDGPGGAPGTLLGTVPFQAAGIPGGLPCAFYDVDISSLALNITDGSVFIGARWNPMLFPSRFVCSDETPATPLHPGFVNFNNPSMWQTTQTVFAAYRAKLIRAIPGASTPTLSLGTVTEMDVCSALPANNNGIIEPGEVVNFTIPISATLADFTNVSGMLTSATPGVTIVAGMGNYGTIAAGASASANYSIQVAETIACDSSINLTLAVTSTEGNFSFPIQRDVGLAAAFVYNGLPLSIPDNTPAGANSTANVAGVPGPITSVEVRVATNHTWVGDLIYTLTSAQGTVITLLDRPGVPNSGAGCSDDNVNVTFRDGEPDPELICAGSGAWPVTVAGPVTPLSTLNGENANGTWTLNISDNAGADLGTLTDWELIIAPAASGTCGICPSDADVNLTKTAVAPDPLLVGSTITYTLTASNSGPGSAADLVVTDILPPQVTYVSNTCGAAFAAPTLTWTIGTLANGATQSCDVVVTVNATGAIANSASATTSSNDPNPANNAATATLGGVLIADVAITKTASASNPLQLGGNVVYTLTVTNNGPSDATGVVVTDAIPANLTYVSNNCGATFAAPTLTWTIGALANAASQSCTVVTRARAIGEIVNTATVTSTNPDSNAVNNSATSTLAGAVVAIALPALNQLTLILLMLVLTSVGVVALRRS